MSLPALVVDASVAFKWVVPEPDSIIAENLIGSFRLSAPELIYAECANIVWKRVRKDEIQGSDIIKLITLVDDLPIETVGIRELLPLAVTFSLRLDHAVYDCFYLALATLQDCSLVTADLKFHRKAHQTLPPGDAKRCLLLADCA